MRTNRRPTRAEVARSLRELELLWKPPPENDTAARVGTEAAAEHRQPQFYRYAVASQAGCVMSADNLLSRLEGVKKTGPGRWIARSPCREDKHPSMAIRELDDGRILLHDFGGSSPEEILAAVNMTFADLFPRKVQHGKPERRPFFPSDVFEIARREVGIVAIIAADLHKLKVVSESDYRRLFVAIERLNGIGEAAYGR